jgi:hypothetical protein
MSDTLPMALPKAMSMLQAREPAFRLDLQAGCPAELLDDLRAERLDAALVSVPAPTDGLRITDAGAEAAVAAVRDCWAAPAGLASLREIVAEPLLTFPRARNPAFHDAVIAAVHAAGEAPVIRELDRPSVESLLLEVAAGSGVAIVAASAAERFITPGVTFRALDASGPRFPQALVTRDETPSPALLAFLRAFAMTCRPARPQPVSILTAA